MTVRGLERVVGGDIATAGTYRGTAMVCIHPDPVLAGDLSWRSREMKDFLRDSCVP